MTSCCPIVSPTKPCTKMVLKNLELPIDYVRGVLIAAHSNVILNQSQPSHLWWFYKRFRAHNSAVECHLHTVEVVGSNPAVPTI